LRIITTLGVKGAAAAVDRLAEAGLDELEVSFYGRTASEYRQTQDPDGGGKSHHSEPGRFLCAW
jgi:hypothetical protein